MNLSESHRRKVLVGQSGASFDDLPIELVIDILSRVPVKTIVQSTCVCKRWHSIIKSPALISAQLARSISNPSNRFILHTKSSTSSPPRDLKLHLLSDENSLSHHASFKIPFETRGESVFIVGSCYGLVCLTDSYFWDHGRDIHLLNPSLQKYKKLSVEASCYADLFKGKVEHVVIGFGYSEVENDYKVVRIVYPNNCKRGTKAEVYSLNRGKWKIVDAPVDQIWIYTSAVFVDGCLYWLPLFDTDPYKLQCFHLHEEVFSKIELPATYHRIHSKYCFNIFQKNGSLVLFNLDDDDVWPCYKLCFTVMEKDNSSEVNWKEFCYETKVEEFVKGNPVGFSSSGRLISWRTCPMMIAAIDLDELCIEKLQLDMYKTFSPVRELLLESDDDEIEFLERLINIREPIGPSDLSVDTNFTESLVLLLD